MSKSLGNMYTLDDLAALGHSPAALRYVLAGAHYRRPLNFTLGGMKDAAAALKKLRRFDDTLATRAAAAKAPEPTYRDLVKNPPQLGAFAPAWASLQDDLNTPEALGHVFSAMHTVKPDTLSPEEAASVRRAFRFIIEALGLILPEVRDDESAEAPEAVRTIAEERWAARQAKDWAKADALRAHLTELGWGMKDGKDGYQLNKL